MATHSSTLAWKIPWTEGPGRLQSMGSLGVRYDWVASLSLFTFMHGRRKWQPTPVFLPGESQGRGAWWAAVYGVAQSQTRLKRLSSSSSSCLSSNQFHLRLRTYLTNQYVLCNKPVCFLHAKVLLSYVNETMYLVGNLPFFKIYVNHFMGWDDSPCANVISKCMLWVRGLVPFSEFWDISFL